MRRDGLTRFRLCSLTIPIAAQCACDPGEVSRTDASTDVRRVDANAAETVVLDAALIDAREDTITLDAPADVAAPDETPSTPDVPLADVPVDAPTTLDLHDVTLFDNPADLADWPVTTTITRVDFQQNGGDGEGEEREAKRIGHEDSGAMREWLIRQAVRSIEFADRKRVRIFTSRYPPNGKKHDRTGRPLPPRADRAAL